MRWERATAPPGYEENRLCSSPSERTPRESDRPAAAYGLRFFRQGAGFPEPAHRASVATPRPETSSAYSAALAVARCVVPTPPLTQARCPQRAVHQHMRGGTQRVPSPALVKQSMDQRAAELWPRTPVDARPRLHSGASRELSAPMLPRAASSSTSLVRECGLASAVHLRRMPRGSTREMWTGVPYTSERILFPPIFELRTEMARPGPTPPHAAPLAATRVPRSWCGRRDLRLRKYSPKRKDKVMQSTSPRRARRPESVFIVTRI